MRHAARTIYSLLLTGILATLCANAQMVTSTLVGQVSDPTGNGVPRAHITATNEGTGIPTAGITSSTGSYSISGLLPGTYTVSVTAPGFSTFKQKEIVINSASVIRINAALRIGSAQQTVEVTGAAPLLHTDSPTIGTTLNAHQIRNLPSPVQGISSLLFTAPGALVGPGGGSSSNTILAGTAHWGADNYLVDGVSVDDLNNGGAAYTYGTGSFAAQVESVNQPPLDTLQEFRILDVNANAEFRSSGTVLMVTKSGTNRFHGDLYEFFQNADLNANSYQLNASGQPRPKANLNQFGGSIGGPIWKNKAFFFFAPSYFRQIQSGLSQLILPSAAMRSGDFSALLGENTKLYNPYTGQPFANNQIPSSMFAPQATALLSHLPTPTVTDSPGLPSGPINYRESVPIQDNVDSYTVRGDYQIAPSDRAFVVYRQGDSKPWEVFRGGPPQYGNESNFGFSDKSVILAETHAFSSTALNDFHASWFIHNSFRVGQNTDFDPSTLFPQLTPGNNRGLPTMGVGGYGNFFNDYGGKGTESPIYSLAFLDNFTKVIHNHSIKAGFEENGAKSFEKSGIGSLGSFSFSGAWTGNQGWPGQPHSEGNAFADFLLGVTNSATRSAVSPDRQEYNRIYAAYVQDTWQATPHLTLTYGIRYMYQSPWKVRDNARSFFDITNNKIALPQNSAAPTLPVNANEEFYNAYHQYFETTQSIGLPTHYMQPSKSNWAPRIGFAYRPSANTVIRGGYGIFYDFLIQDFGAWGSLNLPFGSNTETASTQRPGEPTSPYLPDITFASPFNNPTANLSLHPTLYSDQRDLKNAMAQQYSLTVEHQFRQNWMARVSYVGSVTHQLPWFEMDINQPAMQIPNTPYQNQRPYQPWGTISSVRDGAVQNFNQLQLEAKRRYLNGISLDVNYSWTRSLDNEQFTGGPQQIRFPALDYGNTEFIRTNTLVAHFLYALPFGRGKRFLGNQNGMINSLVGGWQASGIVTYASGYPFSVNFAVPAGFTGWTGGRANRIPGVPVYSRNHGHNVIKGVPWFNPKAFGPPEPWTWGTSGRNSLWGPGYSNWDLSAMKQVSAINEKVHVTLRADFIDAFNHFNPGNPNATVSSPQYGGLPIPTSGMITSGSGNRYVQISLRTSF